MTKEEKSELKLRIEELIEDLRGDRERMLEAKDAIAPDIAIGRLSRLDALS